MIKWFDADMFLPGNEVGIVIMHYGEINNPYYMLGFFSSGKWFTIKNEIISEIIIRYWAFINEPFQ